MRKLAIALCLALAAGPLVRPRGDLRANEIPPAGSSGLVPAARAVTLSARRIVGYFLQSTIYGRGYRIQHLATSGAAERLTHVNYAFANIGPELKCVLGDPFADQEKAFGASESVDGVADPVSGLALRGNFNQLRKLKQLYPQLKVLISIGGWTWSARFSDAALPQNRAAFVASCLELYLEGSFAPGVTAPEVFDGIDVDWEYPGACGDGCNFRPEDTQNFTALLAEFRSQMIALGSRTGKSYLLTIAAPAAPAPIAKMELGKIHSLLDSMNLMTYDFHGLWDPSTNFHAALHESASDPARDQRLWIDAAVQTYLDAGVPPEKLTVGVPFYGRGWTGVSPGPNGDGLYQLSRGSAPGSYEPGVNDYKALVGLETSFTKRRHPQAQTVWIYDGETWWTYDDPESISSKTSYVKSKLLGGVMIWELSGDTPDLRLLSTIYDGLQ